MAGVYFGSWDAFLFNFSCADGDFGLAGIRNVHRVNAGGHNENTQLCNCTAMVASTIGGL